MYFILWIKKKIICKTPSWAHGTKKVKKPCCRGNCLLGSFGQTGFKMCCSKSREKRVEGSWRGKAILAFVGRREYRLQKQQEEECWPFSHTPQFVCLIFSSSPPFQTHVCNLLALLQEGSESLWKSVRREEWKPPSSPLLLCSQSPTSETIFPQKTGVLWHFEDEQSFNPA